jgi:hypothetical protein
MRLKKLDLKNLEDIAIVNQAIKQTDLLSNFSAYPQARIMLSGGKKELYAIYVKGSKLPQIFLYSPGDSLKPSRVSFLFVDDHPSGLSPMVKNWVINKFKPDLVTVNFTRLKGGNFVESSNMYQSNYLEYVYSLKHLIGTSALASGHPSKYFIKKKLRFYKRCILRQPYLKYIEVFNNSNLEEDKAYLNRIKLFLKKWEEDTGMGAIADRKYLKYYLSNQDIKWGVVWDSYKFSVIALTAYMKHPTIEECVISLINKNIRGYYQLGLLTTISQAVAIANHYPEAKWVIVGGKGSKKGQEIYKESFLEGGFTIESHAEFIYGNPSMLLNYVIDKDNFLHRIWEY